MEKLLQKYTGMLLILIICIGFFLRIYKLGEIPAGFHQDEVVNAYVGRYIMQNGVDLYGNKWPLLYFDKWGDYPPVIPMYFSAIGTYIFGTTQFGGRFMTALAGTLALVPMFFLLLMTFRRRFIALLFTLLLAVSPWHLAFSRMATEGILAVTIYLYAIWVLITAVDRKNIFFYILSSILLLTTYLIYPSFRIIVPLTFLAELILVWDKKFHFDQKFYKNTMLLGIICSVIISFLLTFAIGRTVWGKGRYQQTSIIANLSGTESPINAYIINEPNTLVARAFDNKVNFFAHEFVRQYSQYFSPSFLFLDGGHPDWFKTPNSGLFYLTTLLLLIPLVLPFLHKKIPNLNYQYFYFFLALIFIAPFASALTVEFTPNTHRSLLLSALFLFLLAYGFCLIPYVKKGVFQLIILSLLGIEMIFFLHTYFIHESWSTAGIRSDGNRQAVEYIAQNKGKYDHVYMMATGWFPAYYLYFTHDFDKKYAGTFRPNLKIDGVGDVKFIDSDCPRSDFFTVDQQNVLSSQAKILILVNSVCKLPFISYFNKIGTINAAGNQTVYDIYRFDSHTFSN